MSAPHGRCVEVAALINNGQLLARALNYRLHFLSMPLQSTMHGLVICIVNVLDLA